MVQKPTDDPIECSLPFEREMFAKQKEQQSQNSYILQAQNHSELLTVEQTKSTRNSCPMQHARQQKDHGNLYSGSLD